jgi:hypothetical protein
MHWEKACIFTATNEWQGFRGEVPHNEMQFKSELSKLLLEMENSERTKFQFHMLAKISQAVAFTEHSVFLASYHTRELWTQVLDTHLEVCQRSRPLIRDLGELGEAGIAFDCGSTPASDRTTEFLQEQQSGALSILINASI